MISEIISSDGLSIISTTDGAFLIALFTTLSVGFFIYLNALPFSPTASYCTLSDGLGISLIINPYCLTACNCTLSDGLFICSKENISLAIAAN